jgi:hypothetical protein
VGPAVSATPQAKKRRRKKRGDCDRLLNTVCPVTQVVEPHQNLGPRVEHARVVGLGGGDGFDALAEPVKDMRTTAQNRCGPVDVEGAACCESQDDPVLVRGTCCAVLLKRISVWVVPHSHTDLLGHMAGREQKECWVCTLAS